MRYSGHIKNLVISCSLLFILVLSSGYLLAESNTLEKSKQVAVANETIENISLVKKKIDEAYVLKRADENIRISGIVVKFVGGIFSVLSLIFAFLSFLGFREYFSSKKFKEEVKNLLKDYKGKLNKVENSFQKRLDLNYRITSCKIFYSQKLYDKAWKQIEELSKINDYEVNLYKGLILLQRGDYYDAISSFEKARTFPERNEEEVLFQIGKCWYRVSQFAKAMNFFEKAIEIKSNFTNAYNWKALSLRHLGKISEAIEILKEVVAIDKKFSIGYYNLACYYSLLNNKKEAIENLKKAIELNPIRYRKLAPEDPDFSNIRKMEEFKERIIEHLKE